MRNEPRVCNYTTGYLRDIGFRDISAGGGTASYGPVTFLLEFSRRIRGNSASNTIEYNFSFDIFKRFEIASTSSQSKIHTHIYVYYLHILPNLSSPSRFDYSAVLGTRVLGLHAELVAHAFALNFRTIACSGLSTSRTLYLEYVTRASPRSLRVADGVLRSNVLRFFLENRFRPL